MVKPVEDISTESFHLFDNRSNVRPYTIPLRYNNEQDEFSPASTNEKIDQPNRAFPTSMLLSFNRQIKVSEEQQEEESARRNVNDKQVMNK